MLGMEEEILDIPQDRSQNNKGRRREAPAQSFDC